MNGLSYGLDTRGPVGVAVDGQEIYPIWNNRGTHNVEVGHRTPARRLRPPSASAACVSG